MPSNLQWCGLEPTLAPAISRRALDAACAVLLHPPLFFIASRSLPSLPSPQLFKDLLILAQYVGRRVSGSDG